MLTLNQYLDPTNNLFLIFSSNFSLKNIHVEELAEQSFVYEEPLAIDFESNLELWELLKVWS